MEEFMQVVNARAPRWDAGMLWLFATLFIYVGALSLLCGARGRRLGGVMVLYCYLFNVFISTLFMRTAAEEVRFSPQIRFLRDIFIDHSAHAAAEALLNTLMLLPVGLILPLMLKKRRFLKACLVGLSLTLFIETAQLFTHLGEFQTDDLLLNFLGCAVGAATTIFLQERKRKRK